MDFLPVEAVNAMEDFRIVKDSVSEDELEKMIKGLNVDQKRIFDTICRALLDTNAILRLFVSGTGGTGKSFLITRYQHFLKRHPEISIREPEGVNNARAAVTETRIRSWFKELREYVASINALDIPI